MSDSSEKLTCERHGETPVTYVCKHLRAGVACGYHASAERADDPWPDAWCDACEAAFQREGEWNDTNEPDITILCTGCYEETRERNRRAVPGLESGALAVSDTQWSELVRATFERCEARQQLARKQWPAFGASQRWFIDREERTIRFFDEPAETFLLADVTVVGSFSTRTNTWLWSWGNEHYSPEDIGAVWQLQAFGEVRGLSRFSEPHWSAEEVDCWEVTQVAAELLDAEAIYRAPSDHLMLFMLLDNFRVAPVS